MATIKNWMLIPTGQLVGQIYEHESFEDGEEICTSKVVYLDLHNERFAETKSGTKYSLDDPNKSWINGLLEDRIQDILNPIKKL